jgi:lycopene cyclase CruA
MARMGYKVLVFDQRRVGTSHREWNISDEELEKFVETGLFSHEELNQAVATRYKKGLVRFYSQNIPEKPAELWLDRVLDVAIDLGTLLEMARRKFEEAGGVILDYRSFKKVYITTNGNVRSVVEVENGDGKLERYRTRLTVNALGAISPLSLVLQDGKPFDGVCPTVGSTAINFKTGSKETEVDPEMGDVLVTIAHAQHGQQLIWEGFPGKQGEMTVYVFYYDTVSPEKSEQQSLLDLFEHYFEQLPTYKEPGEDFKQLKPVYGYIPARHFRQKTGSASRRGIISVGDATSPQSSLTFCGFGSQVRNLPRLTRLLDRALKQDLLEEKHLRHIGAHQTNLSELWVFSRFMQPAKPDKRPNDVNRMMNSFCSNLNNLGPALTRRFFQDKVRWSDYNRITFGTALRSPRVYPLTFEIIGAKGVLHWLIDYLRLSRETMACKLYRGLGSKNQTKLLKWLENRNRSLALILAARHEEWLASGWL